MSTKTTSRRYRRMLQERDWRSQEREVLAEWESDRYDLPRLTPPPLHHKEAVELIMEYVDEREAALRESLGIMALQLGTVYQVIEEALNTQTSPSTYARGQQIVLERLLESMRQTLRDHVTSTTGAMVFDGLVELADPPF